MHPRTRIFLLSCALGAAALASLPSLSLPAMRARAQEPPVLTEEQKKLVNAVGDAVRAADAAILAAENTRRSADARVTRINSLVSFNEADETSFRQLEELEGAVRAAANPNLLTALDDGKTAVTKAKTDLTTARDALPAEAAGQPAELGTARKNAKDALDRLDKQIAAQDKSKKSLQDTLMAVPSKVKGLAELFPERLATLADIAKDAKPDALLPAVPEALPDFVEVVGLARLLPDRWKNVREALKLAGAENTAANTEVAAAVDKVALDKADSDTVKILQKLGSWMKELGAHATVESGKAGVLIPELIADPVKNGPEASRLIGEGASLNSELTRLSDAWLSLAAVLRGVSVPGFKLTDAGREAQALAEASNQLGIAVSVLQDTLAGDASQFVGDKVSLFYYTDVPRIMKMLNSATYQVGGIKGASEQAALERRRLTEVELDLIEAQTRVSGDQRRVLILEEELRGARAAFSASEDVLRNTTRVLKTRQDDHKRAEDRKNAAKTAFDAAPEDPQKRADFDRASEDFDRSTGQLQGAQERNEAATRDRDAAKQRHDALTSEQSGLPGKIQQARADLAAAQATVVRQRRSAILSAQAESEAFAQARDNAPFWFGPAVAFSSDPVKRVLMFAFNDSKTIFLRGKQADVDVVKDIITQFDSPAPQARLTLWTMEMSSDTSPKGTKNFNKALIVIEEELANNRTLTAAAISFLRDCINDEVNRVANEKSATVARATGLTVPQRLRLARLYFYHQEVRERLGFDEAKLTGANQDHQREVARFTQWTLPDPAGTTTLGEALMVLSLGTHHSRTRAMANFRTRLFERLSGLALHDARHDEGEATWRDDKGKFFTSTLRSLGLDTQLSGNYDPLTSMQTELIHALEKLAHQKAVREVRRATADLQEFDRRLADRSTDPSLRLQQLQLTTVRRNKVRALIPLVNWVRTRFGLNDSAALQLGANTQSTEAELEQFAAARGEINPLRTPNARVAAADQMLKELIISVEDDIERHFVQRMLNSLRQKITRDKIGVGVGVMQRTSMLATNRLIARVDPRASAQLPVGEEQNILESVRQLSQIALAGQAGGPLALFGALDRLPREPPPEVFGINTGNTFQVTPIFDPSGQALRFKFDFVGTTRIQEPDGSTNRQVPRIERHTVNTEVQLSNLEMREISRFDSNARVGRPTEYSGGLPIIKDIPKVRPYLPLLGWFVRRGGKSAVVQQSLIFGQTTIYPTISDIMDLLTPPVTVQ
ncbi:MAG TPA: hypothetical protein VFZ44_14945 [Pyrinomonadaceae bacterium]